ncbi:hypothetical protein [Leifsonia sp. NPDC058230]|uniref:hypothetical protein n=1 Tax=Leifsonia sp. NPDC058230 TaxID=3346391 RepID=UPI0036DEC30C
MTHRITTFTTALSLGGLLFFLSLIFSVPGARALTSSDHGVGYTSSTGWWLGTYSLDDGTRGFCLQAGRPSPVGHPADYVEGDQLGWFSPAQSAQLAYISRNWAATDDRLTAAAGQIATWMVAGMNDQTPDFYAARAGADAAGVLDRANAMVAESSREASLGVTATADVRLSDQGPSSVRVELMVDRLSGPHELAPSTHTGRLDLTGATFEDGSTSATIENGVDVPILPTGDEQTVSVSATAVFAALPYGDRIRVAVSHDDVQSLLVAVPASAAAHAGGEGTVVSPLPFQPTVRTVTSATDAQPGATISDHLVVDIEKGEGLLPHWGLRLDPQVDDASDAVGALLPVEAVVESSLLGPFADEIVAAPAAPADAPVVCTVEVLVSGPGEYDTPECTLAAPGYYVWVEKIDPSRTPADQGGTRMRPWQSTFGIASEITRVTAPVPAATPAMLAKTGIDPVGAAWAGGVALAAGASAIILGSRRPRVRAS